MKSSIRKIKKLIHNPSLYFYDYFRKKLNIPNPNDIEKSIREKQITKTNFAPQIQNASLKKEEKNMPLADNRLLRQCGNHLLSNKIHVKTSQELWDNFDKAGKVVCKKRHYLDKFECILNNFEWVSQKTRINECGGYLCHGDDINTIDVETLATLLEYNIPLYHTEDGFILSIVRPVTKMERKIFRMGCSMTLDIEQPYYDATTPSMIEKELNSDVKYSTEEIERARKIIKEIVKKKISKYNNQPLSWDRQVEKNSILVVDQACNDNSIKKGFANADTFRIMLLDAIKENPNSKIYVKVHPDMIQNPNRGGVKNMILGHYTNLAIPEKDRDRVEYLAEYINPYVLFENIQKVYVCTSQLGFEALMAGKEVYIYGSPFYSGWGIGIQKRNSPAIKRRCKKRSVEEIFIASYINNSRYCNPLTGGRCELEELIDSMVYLRANYFVEKKYQNDEFRSFSEKKLDVVIPVVFSFDENYLWQAIVSALSLLENDPYNRYHLFFLTASKQSKECVDLINEYMRGRKNIYKIDYIYPDKENNFDNGYECRHVSKAAYLRFCIPELIKEYDRIIYSDVDVIFATGLGTLYSENIGEHYIAGTIDVGCNSEKLFNNLSSRYKYWQKYFSNRRGEYINSGLLVMNLRKIRESKIINKWKSLSTFPFALQDQDILNITCYPHIMFLEQRYMVLPKYLENHGYEIAVKEGFICEGDLEKLKKHPVQIHYAGKDKPWANKDVAGGEIWWRFIEKFPTIKQKFEEKMAKNKLFA